jgi:C4-type Zn-finger protein
MTAQDPERREGKRRHAKAKAKATVTVITVDVYCPLCKHSVTAEDTSGSLCHIADQLESSIDCDNCGARLILPAWLKRNS